MLRGSELAASESPALRSFGASLCIQNNSCDLVGVGRNDARRVGTDLACRNEDISGTSIAWVDSRIVGTSLAWPVDHTDEYEIILVSMFLGRMI